MVLLFILIASTSAVLIETPFGNLRGFTHTTPRGEDVDVFLSVRYAQEPIGNLRFEKPKMVEPWSGEYDASEFGSICYPYRKANLEADKTTSEDCLNLNIFVPSVRPNASLPVLVFIYGGGYVVGNAVAYGYKKAAENFVSQGMIFVSIQYRVGFLGFYSTGNDEIPGNLGLWDQTMALQFLNEILPSFGGDVNRITVMGQSAGSASITGLLASPHSNKLFNQAIQLSASGLPDWAHSDKVVTDSHMLAEKVGCLEENVKSCLQEKTTDNFLDAMEELKDRKHPSFARFHPLFDGDFFPEEIDILLEKAPKKKTIQGITNEENFLFTIEMPYMEIMYIEEEKRNDFGRKDILEFLNRFNEGYGTHLSQEQIRLLADFYSDSDAPHNSSFYITRFTELTADYMFNIPVYQETQLKVKNDWETFIYVIDHHSKATDHPSGLITGMVHGGDLRFLMEFYGAENIPLSEEDKQFQEAFLTTFGNFVKNGSPSTDKLEWLSATKSHPDRNLLLNSKPAMTDEFFRKEAVEFWFDRLPKEDGADLRRIFPALKSNRFTEKEEL